MAYSVDFRKAAVEFWQAGCSKDELYAAFKIYPSRVYAWIRHEKATGSLEPCYQETRNSKINLEELKQALERKPDAYLSELAKQFNCSESGIFRALKRLKISLKKSSPRTPNNAQ